MSKVTVHIEIDSDNLQGYADSHLAALWHVAQLNPADGFESKEPGELAERIGREIIRRWLATTPPEMWHHQGHHHDWNTLRKFGKWTGPSGEFEPDPDRIQVALASTNEQGLRRDKDGDTGGRS